MAASILLRLKQVLFGSNLRSKPVRENFQDVENAVNNLQSQLDAALTPPAGSEVVNARDFHPVLRDRLRWDSRAAGNVVLYGFQIKETPTPSMIFRVTAGVGLADGVGVILGFGSWARSGTTITITEVAHGLSNGNKIFVDISTDAIPLPLQEYTVANVTADTFEVTGNASGATSGTCEFSRYSASALTAPAAGETQLHGVMINSDNTISVSTGTAAVDPRIFPAPSTSQILAGGISVKDTSTDLEEYRDLYDFKNGNNDFFPNLYINSAVTIAGRGINNLVINTENVGFGTVTAQGNLFIEKFHYTGVDGGTTTGSGQGTERYTSDTIWRITGSDNVDDVIGSGGSSATVVETGIIPNLPNNGTGGTGLTAKAFNIYVYDMDHRGGGTTDQTTEGTSADGKFGFGSGSTGIGSTNGKGGDAGSVTFTAINEIVVSSAINMSGGDGADGANASSGTIGNIGGKGGPAGNGGSLNTTSKTFTNNGTISVLAGTAGSGGIGSGGSDNNGNGSAGAPGVNGSIVNTLYTDDAGKETTFADWIHPLYLDNFQCR